jgi:signal peptidase II
MKNSEVGHCTLSKEERRARLAFFGGAFAAVFTVLLDQLLKIYIRNAIPVGGRIEVWPGVFHFSHVLNFGAAWGALSGRKFLLIAITLAVVAGAIYNAKRIARNGFLPALGLGFIVGGALGNLYDRIAQGHVTDMIDFDTNLRVLATFPVFNLADCALTFGVILLMIHFFFFDREENTPHVSLR